MSADVVEFHKAALEAVVRFLQRRGIDTLEELNRYKGRKLLDVPLWKILEVRGKYGGRYISEGVRELEVRLGRQVSASSGTWSDKDLERVFRPPPEARQWSREKRYRCQLEHVNERSLLIREILRSPDRARWIVEHHLIGCVVLTPEHKRLTVVNAETRLDDPWYRYRAANPSIRVWCRDTQDWLDLEPVGASSGRS